MMAGAYVGLAIILIFTLGNDVDPCLPILQGMAHEHYLQRQQISYVGLSATGFY